ncbi:RHS repeat-associated core domain-containing protein [Clostridium sp. UBA5119]|uniref:RHS repeat-associated core domain-containing protein n=1 Tax=Clostridium sp. UBA5119 TaxID=1946366 RepID=UPI003216C18C
MLNDAEQYFYIRNAQSDIIGIINSIGKQVVSYTYDTWGKLISITGDKVLGEKNPYRYRGYRYDIETGYYYLQSRYYNPEIGRFLNADGLVSTGQGMLSHNMFAYCANNPVVFKDPLGFAHCMSNEYGGGGGFGAAAIGGSGALADTVKGAWYGTVGTIGAIWNIITFSSNTSKSKNKPKQKGKPNDTEVVRGKDGKVEKYTVFGPDGEFVKEVRLKGKEHGPIPRPNVKEPKFNVNPKMGERFQNGYSVRPATADEIIKWDRR